MARRRARGTDDDPVTSPFAPTGRVTSPFAPTGRVTSPFAPTGPVVGDRAPRFRTALLAFARRPAALMPTWTLVMLALTLWATR